MAAAELRKLVRFAGIYGPRRALHKAAGRLRVALPSWPGAARAPDIGLIGCGQFAFATIGYFLQARFGRCLLACYDVDTRARDTLARALHVRNASDDAEALLATPELRTVYVASNHASHADYAAAALRRGLDVYVEKPIAVTHDQLATLLRARAQSRGRLFAGYNRPFSGAIRDLRQRLQIDPDGGLSMQCFVAGHRLAPGHWYRRPEEGTRICGNVGHWLDLFLHVLRWRGWPDRLEISLAWADPAEPDDNLSVAITSDSGDLFSVMLTSRNEPFEGINESIQLQHGDTTCKIDDFRSMTLWQGERRQHMRYWPKDVGHRRAVLQPYDGAAAREFAEVEVSTLLMLHIAEMVRKRERTGSLSISEARRWLDQAAQGQTP